MKSMSRMLLAIIMFCVLSACDSGAPSPSTQQNVPNQRLDSGQSKPASTGPKTASTIANRVQTDVAKTILEGGESATRAVLVMDERHDSRAAQLQEAILLERLYYNFGSRVVVLEGYLTEDAKLDTGWFDKAVGGSAVRRARVAIQLLKEGEINAAEYWKLVHPEVRVVAAESKAEHATTADATAHSAPEIFLLKIAAQKGESVISRDQSKAHELGRLSAKLDAAIKEFKKVEDSSDAELVERKRTETREAYGDYQEFVIGLDPWTNRTWKSYKENELGSDKPSLTVSADIAEAIQAKAKTLGVALEAEEEQAMQDYITFMRARHGGTLKIVGALRELVANPTGSPVTAIIGMGHSVDMARELDKLDCSYAILRPLVLDVDREKLHDIPFEIYERKYLRQSLYSEGPLEEALKSLPRLGSKKPGVVLEESWLRGKAEVYAYIDRIVDGVFGGGPPYGPPRIPTDWDNSTFKGEHVYVDPKAVVLLADDNDAVVITDRTLAALRGAQAPQEVVDRLRAIKDEPFLHEGYLLREVELLIGKQRAKGIDKPLLENIERISLASVMIPLVINHGKSTESVLWAKATRVRSHIESDERQAVESMLKSALIAVQSGPIMTKSLTDNMGRIHTSFDTVVAFGRSAGVREVSLSQR